MIKYIQYIALTLALILAFPTLCFTSEFEDAQSTGCLPKPSVSSTLSTCTQCHKDSKKRFSANQNKLCTPYCLTCHTKTEMDRHHSVETPMPKNAVADNELILTTEKKISCITCHNMAQPRYDKVRWKATSLFDRIFHQDSQYKTYFLAMRNDLGNLCLTCH